MNRSTLFSASRPIPARNFQRDTPIETVNMRPGSQEQRDTVDTMDHSQSNPARSSVEAFAGQRRQSYKRPSRQEPEADHSAKDPTGPNQGDHEPVQSPIDFELLREWIRNSQKMGGLDRNGASTTNITEPSAVTSSEEKENTTKEDPSIPKDFSPHSVDKSRFTFFSSTSESTIHSPTFADLLLPGEDIRKLFSGSVWWLDVREPTNDEISTICRALGVHPLTIEDITTYEQREKIEMFPSYYFASLRSFQTTEEEHGDEFEPFNVSVLVFGEGILTFQSSSNENDHASNVRNKITSLKDYVALSSDWICYALIDDIVDSFAPSISQLEAQTDAIEDEVFFVKDGFSSNALLRNIGRLRKNCLSLMRLLGGKADVLRSFTKRCNQDYKVMPRMDIGLFLGDVQDHVVTMVGNLGHYERILARSHSNCLAQLSIANIEQGTSTNRTLNQITLLASVIVPLHLISGIWGMNVRVPFQEDQVDSLAPFFTIVAIMVVISMLILAWARRLRLI